jgi:hypothetical protein
VIVVEAPGIEDDTPREGQGNYAENRETTTAAGPRSATGNHANSVSVGSSVGAGDGAVEDALAEGIRRAGEAGEWAVVAQLARELEARRTAKASENVVGLHSKRRRA